MLKSNTLFKKKYLSLSCLSSIEIIAMNKFHQVLYSFFLLSSFFLLHSCNEKVEAPSNLITSDSGVDIALTWITDSTASQALLDADLDLAIFDSRDDLIEDSSSTTDFENITMGNNYSNGVYTIKILLFENSAGKTISYTLTITGNGNAFSTVGNFFPSSPDGVIRSMVEIKKDDNRYAITNF